MNLGRLYTLLVAWCVLLIGPGMLVALGVFGRIDMKSNVPGTVVLPWILGYLAQFGVFMWIMNIIKEQKVLWWLLASLMPWAIDWTLPVSPLYLLLWLPVTAAIAVWIALATERADSLQSHGVRATGVVLEVLKPWMNVVINNVYIRRKLRLRIERADGTPSYEGILKGLFMLGEIPSPGDRIRLRVDPTRPQRFDYDKGADADASAPSRAAAVPDARRDSIADDLDQLARLHDRGAISDAEFAAAKRKLLH